MSCEFCEDERNLIAGAEAGGRMVEEICIIHPATVPIGRPEPVTKEYLIVATLLDGGAWTVPTSYCPMCGERLSRGEDGR